MYRLGAMTLLVQYLFKRETPFKSWKNSEVIVYLLISFLPEYVWYYIIVLCIKALRGQCPLFERSVSPFFQFVQKNSTNCCWVSQTASFSHVTFIWDFSSSVLCTMISFSAFDFTGSRITSSDLPKRLVWIGNTEMIDTENRIFKDTFRTQSSEGHDKVLQDL